MKKLYAAVGPNGYMDFNSIRHTVQTVPVTPSDVRYGNIKVKPINMQRYKGEISADCSWENHKIAWIWENPNGSYWWDTLSDSFLGARNCSSRPDIMIGLGFKVIPVQFSVREIAHLMAA